MENVLVQDLAPGMRLDESLYLPGGEVVLCGGQAVDGILLEALAQSNVTELVLCADAGEAEGLAVEAGCEAVLLDEFPERARFPWGLYETGGRKLLGAGKRLAAHLRSALRSAGVDVALEPASELAPRLARGRRIATRTAAPRRGRKPSADLADVLRPRRAEGRTAAGGPGAVAGSMLAHAVLASEAEAVMGELALGLALDTPRAVASARGAVREVFADPFLPVACSLQALSSGLLRDHAAASATVAAAVARASGLAEDECLEVALCALLHDAANPLRAMRALADADGLAPPVALWALQVHERLDGSGYPLRLRGDEILPPARLLAVVDVLCALLAPRPHRSELSGREAVDLCVRLAGDGQLDGDAVRALISAVGLYPVGSAVKLSTGECARVVALSEAIERPVVSVVRTSSGKRPAERRVMDLSRLEDVKIESALAREEAPWEGEAGF